VSSDEAPVPTPREHPTCPHCGTALSRFSLPEAGGWIDEYHFACFSDECPYFRNGWIWMFEHYGVRSSYRYRIDLAGHESPLPVWSKTAIRDRILEDDVTPSNGGGDAISADRSAQGGDQT
jgi:hypothetical protein